MVRVKLDLYFSVFAGYLFSDSSPSKAGIRELNFSKHLSRDSIESESTRRLWAERDAVKWNFFYWWEKRGFILSFCSSMGVSGTALHQCPETACCGAIFKQKRGFFSGSPLATPGHQGAVPMGPAPALVPSAGRDAGTPLLGWQRNMLPSIFLLKAGNKEGWKVNLFKRHIYGPWFLLEQQGLCWRHRATGEMVTKKIKSSAGIIFGSAGFTPIVKSFDTKGSCSFQSTNMKQKGTCIPYIHILFSAGSP